MGAALEDEIRRLKLDRAKPPSADPQAGMDQEALQTALSLCWEYSIDGIEGTRAGHIIAVGPGDAYQKMGKTRGHNGYANGKVYIHRSTGKEDVGIEMNQDG